MLLKKIISLPVIFFLFSLSALGQNELETINKEVWYPFYKAFATHNSDIMAEIHSKDLSRITANSGRISSYEEYIARNKRSFEWMAENGQTTHIALRFFERLYSEDTASERGIYQTIQNKGKSDERISYGQFFVLLKKENGVWKILLDYDSNEKCSIGEKKFNDAHSIVDIKPFIKN